MNPGSIDRFTLGLNFTVPTFSLPAGALRLYTATVTGQITGNGTNGDITIDFTQSLFDFAFSDVLGGTGTFQFYIPNDITLLAGTALPRSVLLTGHIQNFVYTAPVVPTEVPVPEPATLMLLGTGLFAVATRARRKRQ